MAQVAGNHGEFSLGFLNDSTGWVESHGFVDDPCFTITGTFVGTIQVQTSDQSDYVKTRFTVAGTYTAPTGSLAIPRIAGRRYRLIMTAYTSGTAYVGIAKPNIAASDSIACSPSPQVFTNNPVGDEF